MKVIGISGAALVAMLGLAACGGGGGGGASPSPQPSPPPSPSGAAPSPAPAPAPASTYSIGGTVTGLVGSALVIANNAGEQLTLTASADFAFATELADSEAYAVTIVSHPVSPERFCTVENGTGTVAGADVTDVAITCTGPLALLSAAPVDGDEQVSRAVQPLLNFSADIDAATATAAFTLSSEHRTETVIVDVAGDTVTLAPEAPLLPLTDYTLTISDALRGTAGERPMRSESLAFRTRDGLWSPAETLGAGFDAHVASAPDGRAWVVWTSPLGSTYEVFADSYDPVGGWAHAPEAIGVGSSPVIAIDAAGDATVAWLNASNDVLARRHDATLAEWADPETVSGTDANASFLDIDVDSQGRVLLVWQQNDASGPSIGSAYYSGGDWAPPALAELGTLFAYSPRVRFLPDGSALAAWRQYDGGAGTDIAVSRFDATNGWGPTEIINDAPGTAYDVDLAVDASGNALAVWGQSEAFEEDIFASYFTPAGGWQTPQPLESQAGNTDYPKVAFGPDGSAIAVWEQIVRVGTSNITRIYQNRFTPGSGWGTETAISSVGNANYPRIVIDANGNALSTWWVLDTDVAIDAYSVWANRHTPAGNWTTAEKIDDVGELIDTFGPRLAIDASGNAIAAWGARGAGVFASRFE